MSVSKNNLEKAIAAAREANTDYADNPHVRGCADACAYALRDLLAALDAARGEAVAFRAPGAQSWLPITEQKRLDELIAADHVFEFAYAAPPAPLAVSAEPPHDEEGLALWLSDWQAQQPAPAVPEGYALVPVEPPFPKKWIAKGVRVVNGEELNVWLRYTDEGGGWHQWDTSRSGAKLFDSAEAAIKAAHGCPGPHFCMPAKGSITAEEVESPKATQYRAMLAAAARKGE